MRDGESRRDWLRVFPVATIGLTCTQPSSPEPVFAAAKSSASPTRTRPTQCLALGRPPTSARRCSTPSESITTRCSWTRCSGQIIC